MEVDVDLLNESEKKMFDDFVEAIEASRDEATKTLDIYFDNIQKEIAQVHHQKTVMMQGITDNSQKLLSYVKSEMAKCSAEKKLDFLSRMTRSFSNGNWVCQTFNENKLKEATSVHLNIVDVKYHYEKTVDCISQLYRDATVPLTEEVEVVVTYVNDPGDFYVVRVCDQEKYQAIQTQIKDNAHTYAIPDSIEPGQIYAVSNGSTWYRGKCNGSCGYQTGADNRAEALYQMVLIDFGPTQQICASSVRMLPDDLLHDAFAMQCTINKNIKKWSLQKSKQFSSLTLSKLMRMTIIGNMGKVHEVDLSQLPSATKEASTNSVRNAMFPPVSQDTVAKLVSKLSYPAGSIRPEHLRVRVTTAGTPFGIYVRILDDDQENFAKFQQDLQSQMRKEEKNHFSVREIFAGEITMLF